MMNPIAEVDRADGDLSESPATSAHPLRQPGPLTQALGYTAIRAGYTVCFIHSDNFSRAMAQARVDNSTDRAFRSFLTPTW